MNIFILDLQYIALRLEEGLFETGYLLRYILVPYAPLPDAYLLAVEEIGLAYHDARSGRDAL